jgi:chromosome segregation ATPase
VRQLVLTNREDDFLREKFDTLQCLARDDRQEAEMLRSRIDQQSELIAILKQRADKSQERCESQLKRIVELDEARAALECQASEERRQREILEQRFFHLNENHVQMIAIKDEYKAENEELRRENERLRQENKSQFSEIMQEKNNQLKELQTKLKETEEKYCTLDDRQSKAKEEADTKQRQLNERIKKLEHDLTEMKQTHDQRYAQLLQRNKDSLHEVEKKDKKIKQLCKDQDDLTKMAMERGRTIEEYQQMVSRLNEEKQQLTKRLESAEKQFQNEVMKVSKDVRVCELAESVVKLEKRLSDVQLEYSAYKKHANELLTKEKDLNAKLRHMVK